MPASTLERTAQTRIRRTRSRTVSQLPALAVSSLKPHEYDLEPACISLVCPSCRTWVPINKPNTLRPKLVPHHTETAGTEDPVRCPGSHRLVVIDVEVERWRGRLEEGVAETDGRRSTRVTRKPKAVAAPAVMQILSPILDAQATLKMYEAHTKGCATCAPTGPVRCIDGSRLAHLVAHKKRTEPSRRKTLKIREELAELREQGVWLLRERQWASTADSVRQADIQRAHDTLEALLRPLTPQQADGPQLSDWERVDLMSAITMLATKVEQLRR